MLTPLKITLLLNSFFTFLLFCERGFAAVGENTKGKSLFKGKIYFAFGMQLANARCIRILALCGVSRSLAIAANASIFMLLVYPPAQPLSTNFKHFLKIFLIFLNFSFLGGNKFYSFNLLIGQSLSAWAGAN